MRPFLLLLALLPIAAQAQTLATCDTALRGDAATLTYDPATLTTGTAAPGLMAQVFGGKAAITCPGLVTLRALTPEMDDAMRAPFCLQWDPASASYAGYDLGPRDADLTCRTLQKAFCQRVSVTRAITGGLGGLATDLAVEAGTEAVLHGAGVESVQGPASLMAERLVQMGAATLQGATPAGLAVTAVTVGGALYLCSDKGAAGAALQADPARLKPGEMAPGVLLPVQRDAAPLPAPDPIRTAPLPGATSLTPPNPTP